MRRDRWSSPEAPQFTRAASVGNLVLRRVLLAAGGVDKHTLRNLVGLKDALAEEFLAANGGEDSPTAEYVADLDRQLTELVANHSEDLKARECAEARERLLGRYPGYEDGRAET